MLLLLTVGGKWSLNWLRCLSMARWKRKALQGMYKGALCPVTLILRCGTKC